MRLGPWVAATLRGGTLLAIVLVVAGMAWTLAAGGAGAGGRPVLEQIGEGGGDAVTALGLLVLTLVPPATVVMAALAFARSGERRMVAATLLVTVLLVASLGAAVVLGGVI